MLSVCTGESSSTTQSEKYHTQILSNANEFKIYHYFNLLLLKKLYYICKHFKPDIINVHNINLQTFSLGTLLFSWRYPLVWTLHDVWAICMVGWPATDKCDLDAKKCESCTIWPTWMVKINRYLKEWVYKHSCFSVICPSQWLKNLLRESHLGQHSMSIINNGISSTLFYPLKDDMSFQSMKSNYKTLLFCGGKKVDKRSPAVRKGWEILSSALIILSNWRNDIRLLYVGDPVETRPDYPVPIKFVGRISRNDMSKYYNQSDLFLLPTLADNSPLTIIEAMACKVPIIATDVGGIREMIVHNQTGLLCKPRNPNSFAMAIDLMLSDDRRRQEMAEQAYLYFKEKFSIEQMVDSYELCFQHTIESWERSMQMANNS